MTEKGQSSWLVPSVPVPKRRLPQASVPRAQISFLKVVPLQLHHCVKTPLLNTTVMGVSFNMNLRGSFSPCQCPVIFSHASKIWNSNTFDQRSWDSAFYVMNKNLRTGEMVRSAKCLPHKRESLSSHVESRARLDTSVIPTLEVRHERGRSCLASQHSCTGELQVQ